MFIRSFIFALCVCLSLCVSSLVANAQQCKPYYEIIVTMRDPDFGVPTVWDATYKRDDRRSFEFDTLLFQNRGTVLAVGRRVDARNDRTQEVVWAEINRRGRSLRYGSLEHLTNERPIKVLRHKNGYLLLSNFEDRSETSQLVGAKKSFQQKVKLAWYNSEFEKIKEKIIEDDKYDLVSRGIIPSLNQGGVLVVLQATDRIDLTDNHSVLAEYDADGREVWKRSYRIGVSNTLHSVKAVDDKSYIGVGQIKTDATVDSGWSMKVDKTGALLWQKAYRQGVSSVLYDAIVKKSDNNLYEAENFIFSGQTEPSDGGPPAAWLMKTGPLGQSLWKRYFRLPEYDFAGRWLFDYGDGRMIVIGNARKEQGTKGRDHTRMLTLSPRGILLNDEAYIEGFKSAIRDYVKGANGERAIAGIAAIDLMGGDDELQDEIKVIGLQKEDEMMKDDDDFFEFSGEFSTIINMEKDHQKRFKDVLSKGWVLVAPALDAYRDPCVIQ